MRPLVERIERLLRERPKKFGISYQAGEEIFDFYVNVKKEA